MRLAPKVTPALKDHKANRGLVARRATPEILAHKDQKEIKVTRDRRVKLVQR